MVIESSGRPSILISCKSALPMEVTRSKTSAYLPSTSACGGTVDKWPSHEPARVLMVAKDFCASDGTGATEDFCASDWAKATVESDSRTTDSIKRRDFIFHSP